MIKVESNNVKKEIFNLPIKIAKNKLKLSYEKIMSIVDVDIDSQQSPIKYVY